MKPPPGKGTGPTLAGVEPGRRQQSSSDAHNSAACSDLQIGARDHAEAHAMRFAPATAESLAAVRSNVPPELLALPNWVASDRTPRPDGKPSKTPLNPHTGGNAKSSDPATWGTFDAAAAFAIRDSRAFGVGVNLLGTEFVGLDLDHVVDVQTGEVLPTALQLVESLGTYTERSPSGTGIRMFMRGRKPAWFPRSSIKDVFGPGTALEVYDGAGGGRYLTVTGETWHEQPLPIAAAGDLEQLRQFVERTATTTTAPTLFEPREVQAEAGIGAVRRGRGKMAPAGTASLERFAEAESALRKLDPSMQRDGWVRVIFSVKAALDADERGAALLEQWSACTTVPGQYKPGESTDIYSGAVQPWDAKSGPPLVDAGTLWAMARAEGWTWPPQRTIEDVLAPSAVPAEPAVEGGQVESAEDIEKRDALNEPAQDTSSAEAFPMDLVGGDDLLSAIVQFTVATSQRPQPALALANAIAFLGAVLGRRVAGSTDLRTNFMTIGVAPTAGGKEHSQKITSDLAEAAGLHALIKGAWKSGSALVTSLYQQPSQIVQIDEFGKFLQLQAGKHVPPHIQEIRTVLLQVSNRANGTFRGDCYADPRENQQKVICEPNLCYYGATTPEPFFAALQSGAIIDGFLNRHLVFFADGRPPRQRPARQEAAQVLLVARLKELELATKPAGNLAGGGIGGLPTFGSGCRRIEFDDAGYRAWAAIADGADRKHDELDRKQDRSADLWGRYGEHVAKLALLRAVACDSHAKFVGRSHVEWADAVAGWCHRRMHREVERHLADTEVEQRTRRVLRIIEDAGPRGLSQTVLVRKTQWLTPRERKECLENLVEAKHVASTTHPPRRTDGKGKPATIIRATSWDRRRA